METTLTQLRDQMIQTRQYIYEAQQSGNRASLNRWMGQFRDLSRQAEVLIAKAVGGMAS